MKMCIKNPFVLPVVVAGLGWVLACHVTAQTFATLYNFKTSDGIESYGTMLLSGDTLYGTMVYGGGGTNGTVFAINTNGTGFSTLYTFSARSTSPYPYTNSDGGSPSGLVLLGTNVFGTADYDSIFGSGAVFELTTDGKGFADLYSFTALSNGSYGTNGDGGFPYGPLVLENETLYGTTTSGGADGAGTIFAIETDGTGFTNLHDFFEFSDGADSWSGLTLSGNTLFGTALLGGSGGNGTVFSLGTDGTQFTNLHSFAAYTAFPGTNIDGALPNGGLILSNNALYGTTAFGGSTDNGTVFVINTDGTEFQVLHRFLGNNDGAQPQSGLVLVGTTLYGTTRYGGISGNGTVFGIQTDGSGYRVIHSFTGPNDGASPYGGLVVSGPALYGTTVGGGSFNNGTLFSISLQNTQPQLTITPTAANVILSWPTNFSGFALQSATNLSSPIWTTNFPAPLVVNGQFTVTNLVSGSHQFFRLSQ